MNFIFNYFKSIFTSCLKLASKKITNPDDWVDIAGISVVNTVKLAPFAVMFEYATGLITLLFSIQFRRERSTAI